MCFLNQKNEGRKGGREGQENEGEREKEDLKHEEIELPDSPKRETSIFSFFFF